MILTRLSLASALVRAVPEEVWTEDCWCQAVRYSREQVGVSHRVVAEAALVQVAEVVRAEAADSCRWGAVVLRMDERECGTLRRP